MRHVWISIKYNGPGVLLIVAWRIDIVCVSLSTGMCRLLVLILNTQYSVNNNTQEVIQLIENIKPPLQCADGGDGAVLLSTVCI